MVRLTKIYTRGGDKGETSLGDGSRVAKHNLRVAAYGTVDEANAVIGIARLHVDASAGTMLARIQNDLFDLGADLCTPEASKRNAGALRKRKLTVSMQSWHRWKASFCRRAPHRQRIFIMHVPSAGAQNAWSLHWPTTKK